MAASTPRTFLADANVGLFPAINQPPLVPDVFVSLGVVAGSDLLQKRNRSYFLWEFGKPPEVVIEIVADRRGSEAGMKLREYATIGIVYYVILDPLGKLSTEPLRVHELHGGKYTLIDGRVLPGLGIGLLLWRGIYEGIEQTWLRWCDSTGNLLPTGAERAEQQQQRAEQERERAEQQQQRAEQERERAERLLAQLRALGIQPQADESEE